MATLAQIITARDDRDLQSRIIAAVQEAGLEETWARPLMGRLVTQPIPAESGATTIADVYAYAAAVWTPDKAAPGSNPAAVTDTQIRAAVAALAEAEQ